jgi:hypothetical protein
LLCQNHSSNVIQINKVQHHTFQLQKIGFRDFSIQIELDLAKYCVSEQTQYFIQIYHTRQLFQLELQVPEAFREVGKLEYHAHNKNQG